MPDVKVVVTRTSRGIPFKLMRTYSLAQRPITMLVPPVISKQRSRTKHSQLSLWCGTHDIFLQNMYAANWGPRTARVSRQWPGELIGDCLRVSFVHAIVMLYCEIYSTDILGSEKFWTRPSRTSVLHVTQSSTEF